MTQMETRHPVYRGIEVTPDLSTWHPGTERVSQTTRAEVGATSLRPLLEPVQLTGVGRFANDTDIPPANFLG